MRTWRAFINLLSACVLVGAPLLARAEEACPDTRAPVVRALGVQPATALTDWILPAVSSVAAVVPAVITVAGLGAVTALVGAVLLADSVGTVPVPVASRAASTDDAKRAVSMAVAAAWGTALMVPVLLAVGALVDGAGWLATTDDVSADAIAWRAAVGVAVVALTAPWFIAAALGGGAIAVSSRWQVDGLEGDWNRMAMVATLGLGPLVLLAVPVVTGAVAGRSLLGAAAVRALVLGRRCAPRGVTR